jgi:hypothetical protein
MFYVYELRDATGVPFYVGKGSGRRIFQHEINARAGKVSHVCCKIRHLWSLNQKVGRVKVFETDSEEAAFQEERRLIAYYGREKLTNETDGGDGTSNPSKEVREKIASSRRGKKATAVTRHRQRMAKIGTHVSEETKAKISAAMRGSKHPWASRPRSDAYRKKMSAVKRGIKMPPGTGAKISAAKMGHPVSQETRNKISKSKKGKPAWNKGIRRPNT